MDVTEIQNSDQEARVRKSTEKVPAKSAMQNKSAPTKRERETESQTESQRNGMENIRRGKQIFVQLCGRA